MEQPEFGYISSDINHLTSIPILVIMPLAILLAVCYWFRKKKESIKEKEQSKWRLLSVGVILCFGVLVFVCGVRLYSGMIFEKPKCKEHYQQPSKFVLRAYNHGPYIKSPDIFYDFQAYRTAEFPWCPEDREAVEKMLGIDIEKEKPLENIEK